MRTLAVLNQKGGVGKTATAVNLSAALASLGKRVCLLDLDPQAHATLHLGIEPAGDSPSIYNALTGSVPLRDVRREAGENLWVVGSHIDLAAAEVELAGMVGREVILRDLLAEDEGGFDFVIMDCPPSLGLLTLNALAAADEVLIPLQPHFLALHGVSKLLETIRLVSRRLNRRLQVTGVALCLYETGTRLAAEVSDDLMAFFSNSTSGPTPWSSARVFKTRIRRNIRLAEAPSYGKSIFQYAPESNGAQDYSRLAAEVLEHWMSQAAPRSQAAP
jgi:chromosome partitioning protein